MAASTVNKRFFENLIEKWRKTTKYIKRHQNGKCFPKGFPNVKMVGKQIEVRNSF